MTAPLALALALALAGQHGAHAPGRPHAHPHGYVAADGSRHHVGGRITPPGPGYGWGFPNGAPDGYGWVDYGTTLPLGADRTPDYYFRRQYAMPVAEMWLPTYYNPYLTRGQRYLPYSGCGGDHPAGGAPLGPAEMPMYPTRDLARRSTPVVTPPVFTGSVGGLSEPSGGSGLIP